MIGDVVLDPDRRESRARRRRTVTGGVFTAVAAVVLVLHWLWPDRIVLDTPVLALLLIAALPWLGGILSSVTLPGGTVLALREAVEAKQQAAEAQRGVAGVARQATRDLTVDEASQDRRYRELLEMMRALQAPSIAPPSGTGYPSVAGPYPAGPYPPFRGYPIPAPPPPDREYLSYGEDTSPVSGGSFPGPVTGAGPAGTRVGAGPEEPEEIGGRHPDTGPDVGPADTGPDAGPVDRPPPADGAEMRETASRGDADLLSDLVDEYGVVRAGPRGPARTAAMTAIVGAMTREFARAPWFDAEEALASRLDGLRLAGYVAMFARPEPDLLPLLVEATVAEPLGFNQYWAVRALTTTVDAAPAALSPSDLARLRALRERLPSGSDRADELDRLFRRLARA